MIEVEFFIDTEYDKFHYSSKVVEEMFENFKKITGWTEYGLRFDQKINEEEKYECRKNIMAHIKTAKRT